MRPIFCEGDQVTLNVGGMRFTTTRQTLGRVPHTRLSRLATADVNYNREKRELFYDRNPKMFGSILDFYRTGELHFSHCLCGPLIKKELEFWEISEEFISPCCWKAFKGFEQEKQTMKLIEDAFAEENTDASEGDKMKRNWRAKIWQFLECPWSSNAAKIWSWLFFVLVIISISVICMDSHPVFRVDSDVPYSNAQNITNPKLLMFLRTDTHPVLLVLDTLCTFIFSVELIIKIIVCPAKLKYIRSPYNIMYIMSVAAMLTTTLVELINPHIWTDYNIFPAYAFLSIASILRAIMLFKFVRHHTGLRILFLAVKASMNELVLLLMIMGILTIIFSTLIYYAEFSEEDNFPSIPIGFWWAIVTMTTVGYGDKVPKSSLGFIVGSLCAIAGMLSTGLPIPVIANNFNMLYSYARLRSRSTGQDTSSSQDEGKKSTKASKYFKPKTKSPYLQKGTIELGSISKSVCDKELDSGEFCLSPKQRHHQNKVKLTNGK